MAGMPVLAPISRRCSLTRGIHCLWCVQVMSGRLATNRLVPLLLKAMEEGDREYRTELDPLSRC